MNLSNSLHHTYLAVIIGVPPGNVHCKTVIASFCNHPAYKNYFVHSNTVAPLRLDRKRIWSWTALPNFNRDPLLCNSTLLLHSHAHGGRQTQHERGLSELSEDVRTTDDQM
jgi:hypothetical protein